MASQFVNENGRWQFIVDGEPFLALAGEVHNSSASSAAYMEPIWPKCAEIGLNTLIMPVYWELCEPEPANYDFALVSEWLEQARKWKLRLIFLWFGTWKNAQSTYVPEWMKCDLQRYPRAILANGVNSRAITPFCTECQNADAAAFAAFMAFLREYDWDGRVIAVQVENESGLLGADRDYSPAANQIFASPVPNHLHQYLQTHRELLSPNLEAAYNPSGHAWKSVFGLMAEETFMAYHTALFVDAVAAAGKAEYKNIPLFVNAWTAQCPGEYPGTHPSGGPVAEQYAVWRAAAPHIDAIAPDLYLETFAEDFALYAGLPGNPFLLPETRNDRWAPGASFFAFGQHNALCFSPFAIEDVDSGNAEPLPPGAVVQSVFQTMAAGNTLPMLRDSYRVLTNLMPLLTAYGGTPAMSGFVQSRLFQQTLHFPAYTLEIRFSQFIDQAEYPAGGLIIALSDEEYLFAGFGFSVLAHSNDPAHPTTDIACLEEGEFHRGQWIQRRRLNGDELHLHMPDCPAVYRVKLYNY